VIFEIVSRTELFKAEFALKLSALVFRFDVTPQVGRRPGPVATLGTQKPSTQVKSSMTVQLKAICYNKYQYRYVIE